MREVLRPASASDSKSWQAKARIGVTMRNWSGVVAILPLEEKWGIVKWTNKYWKNGTAHYDIHHDCDKSWSKNKIPKVCDCGAEIPEAVQGFLVICRSRNEV